MDLNSLKYLRIGVLTTLVAVATLVYACGKENLSEPEEESEVMNTGATATKQAASAPPGGSTGAASTHNPENSLHPQFCSNQWKACPPEKVPPRTVGVSGPSAFEGQSQYPYIPPLDERTQGCGWY